MGRTLRKCLYAIADTVFKVLAAASAMLLLKLFLSPDAGEKIEEILEIILN